MDNQWKILVLVLQQIAQQKGLKQEDIAIKSGMNQSHVSRFFALKFTPNIENFLKIAKAVEVNFFFEDKESKTDLNLAMEKAMEQLGRRVDKLSKN